MSRTLGTTLAFRNHLISIFQNQLHASQDTAVGRLPKIVINVAKVESDVKGYQTLMLTERKVKMMLPFTERLVWLGQVQLLLLMTHPKYSDLLMWS